MLDFEATSTAFARQEATDAAFSQPDVRIIFQTFKRSFDIAFSILLLPMLCLTALCLVVLNPFFNRGPLLYIQPRMGRDCRAFPAMKFRSMLPAANIARGANDPLETHRITTLGQFLRKSRLDELPQVLNVLRGDMSLIGPRPDYFHHARYYLRVIPGYRARHRVRPGISGLAQTQLGYAAGLDATAAKVRADLYYIENAGFRLETWIFWRTVLTVLGRHGA
ncbi:MULTISPECIES: sugar transferase [Marinovum]|nr:MULTISPECIES: sugar transferase [Marinovum]MDD9739586.1 sugar transferase [Marinovum sp. SP66]MDD9745388.1 sugar transferase [Marinovum sp. PR37]